MDTVESTLLLFMNNIEMSHLNVDSVTGFEQGVKHLSR